MIRIRRTVLSIGAAALIWVVAAEPLQGEPPVTLASAQVVHLAEWESLLRLAANGPIAFTVLLPADGEVDDGARVRARLHGVRPGTLATLGSLAPFGVTTAADGGDTILVVSSGEVPAGRTLQLRQGRRSNEIEARWAGPQD